MMTMMKATDFARVLTKIATERKTVYLKGGFGAPITDAILKQLKNICYGDPYEKIKIP